VPTDAYEQALKAAGRPVPSKVNDFLREFAGLHVFVPPNSVDGNLGNDFEVEISNPHLGPWPDILPYCQERIGRTLWPIGSYHRAHCVLLMDSDGNVYGTTDDYLWQVGTSGYDAIEAIVQGREVLRRFDN
jgi:hypothetical protein